MTFYRAESSVLHLEVDKRTPQNLLLADNHSLKTTNEKYTTLIVGSALSDGYREGYGNLARFSHISGFYQMNTTHVLVADHTNDCLRIIDRIRRTTSQFLGNCNHREVLGSHVDGAQPRFFRPMSLLNYRNNGKWLFLSEAGNQAIRQVYLESKYVYTLIRSEKYGELRNMAEDPHLERLYVSSDYQILQVNMNQGYTTITALAGSPSTNGLRDGSFAETQFLSPRGIAVTRDSKLVVADNAQKGRLRLLDLYTLTTASLCLKTTCDVNQPYSLLMLQDVNTICIGAQQAISCLAG